MPTRHDAHAALPTCLLLRHATYASCRPPPSRISISRRRPRHTLSSPLFDDAISPPLRALIVFTPLQRRCRCVLPRRCSPRWLLSPPYARRFAADARASAMRAAVTVITLVAAVSPYAIRQYYHYHATRYFLSAVNWLNTPLPRHTHAAVDYAPPPPHYYVIDMMPSIDITLSAGSYRLCRPPLQRCRITTRLR